MVSFRAFSAFVAAGLTAVLLADSAGAHAPHDDAKAIAISPNYQQDQTVFAVLQLSDLEVFARTRDGGATWEVYGAPFVTEDVQEIEFSRNYAWDHIAFVATAKQGVWRTNDSGETWMAMNTGLSDLSVRTAVPSPGFGWNRVVVAATGAGPFRSEDGGATWTDAGAGYVDFGAEVATFATDLGGTVFSGRTTVHRSDDDGQTWTPLQTFPDVLVSLAVSPNFTTDGTLAVSFGASGNGVQVSTDGGQTWTAMTNGLVDLEINDVAFADDGTLFAAARTDGVYRADAVGGTWTLFQEGFESLGPLTQDHFRDLAISPRFGATGELYIAAYEGIFRSVDRGQTWEQADIYGLRGHRRVRFSPRFATDRTLFTAAYGGGLATYTMDGTAPAVAPICTPAEAQKGVWEQSSTGLKVLWGSVLTVSPSFLSDNTLFYSYSGIWRSTDGGAQFTKYPTPGSDVVRSLTLSPKYPSVPTLLMGLDASAGTGGVQISNDDGQTWTPLTGGLPTPLTVHKGVFSPTYATDRTIFLGTRAVSISGGTTTTLSDALYVSRDGGLSFSLPPPLTSGLPALTGIRVLEMSPDPAAPVLFLGTKRFGLWVSSDQARTFTSANSGLPNGGKVAVEALVFSPTFVSDRTLFLATRSFGVWKSTDGGASWFSASFGLPLHAPWDLAISPDYPLDGIVALATAEGLFVTEDGGGAWHELPGYIRADDGYPGLHVDGSWIQAQDPASLGLQYSKSSTPEDSMELHFTGESVTWVAPIGPASGIAEVFVDDVSAGLVDLYSPTPASRQDVFTTSFGANETHTIRVRVTGTMNPASTGISVQSDGFRVGIVARGPYLPYGNGVAGTGGFLPSISASACPAGGAAVTVQVDEALGGTVGVLLVGSERYALPSLGGALLTDRPYNWYPHVTTGTSGLPGGGTYTVQLATPAEPTLIGSKFYLQAGYMDPGGPAGASLTGGLEVTLRAP
jgi:hypothetical protein